MLINWTYHPGTEEPVLTLHLDQRRGLKPDLDDLDRYNPALDWHAIYWAVLRNN